VIPRGKVILEAGSASKIDAIFRFVDGLYWPTAEGEPPSPLGPLVAEARTTGYRRGAKGEGPTPYHGYFYKLLTSQGPSASGGAADYIVNAG
jgi:Protein of unknown function (DUF2950)